MVKPVTSSSGGATRAVALLVFGGLAVYMIASLLGGGTKHVQVWKNGGNNTAGYTSVSMHVDPKWSLEEFSVRAALKLNYIPKDQCINLDPKRPRESSPDVFIANSPDSEPLEDCNYAQRGWQFRVYNDQGLLLSRLGQVHDGDHIFIVPAHDLWVWPGMYVGRRVPLHGLRPGKTLYMETLSLEPRLFLIEDFLADSEGAEIMEIARPQTFKSQVVHSGKNVRDDSVRTSTQAWLYGSQHKVVDAVEKRSADLVRIDYDYMAKNSDALQVLRYEIGQHYFSHYDWFDPNMQGAAPGLAEGYNRFITVFMYMTDVEEGGQTVFPLSGPTGYKPGESRDYRDCVRGLPVKPRKGAAVFWYNMLAPGNRHEAFLDNAALHGGCDVIKGEKWATNKWFFNQKWKAN